MSGAADYYVHLLQQRLCTLATDKSDMERAQQLCTTVNNMEHVRHSLTLLQEELQVCPSCMIQCYYILCTHHSSQHTHA